MRVTARWVLAPYLIALGWIVWAPEDDALQVTGIVAVVARLFEPLGMPFAIGYPIMEVLANVALFVPLGVLLTLGWPRVRWWQVLLIGLALTLTIEGVQTKLPSRYPTVSDVMANTAGAVLGWALVRVALRDRTATTA